MEAQDARTEVRTAAQNDTPETARAARMEDPTDVPSGPRPLADIQADLQKPIPERLLETKRIGGQEITYVPWYRAQKILDHYCRGFWEYRVVERWQKNGDFMMTVEITIHAAEGTFRRQGTGREEPGVTGFGDAQSNAESMAFRRCCARWGLGLGLYEGDA
jgi:hypothetical protein